MLEKISGYKSFGGTLGYYRHQSAINKCPMRFAIFIPHHSPRTRLPLLTYLAGLACTEETFMLKAGAQRHAAECGLILVAPDTSPRGEDVPDDRDWDFGQGAGFYVDATEAPWNQHYKMYSYVTQELTEIIFANFPADPNRQGIFGHSMGGHGALIIALRNPQQYKSVSAFAPICAPMQCPWGQKAFSHYLGNEQEAWKHYDATELIKTITDASDNLPILIDQGLDDQFLDTQLHPHLIEQAAANINYRLTLRRHDDYDHSYFFISTFMEDHIRHHVKNLV
ncbi:MAG: S-formylglutathione hydrolase [Gammaproteobacteria bacterium]